MKRKSENSSPSKIYIYYAYPDAVTSKVLENDVFQGHKYKNALIEMKRVKHTKMRALQEEFIPGLADLNVEIDELEESLHKINEALRKVKDGETKQSRDSGAIHAFAHLKKSIIYKLESLRERRNVLKTENKKLVDYTELNQWEAQEVKDRRNVLTFHNSGTYIKVGESVNQANDKTQKLSGSPPKQQRFRKGHSTIQLTKSDKYLNSHPVACPHSRKTPLKDSSGQFILNPDGSKVTTYNKEECPVCKGTGVKAVAGLPVVELFGNDTRIQVGYKEEFLLSETDWKEIKKRHRKKIQRATLRWKVSKGEFATVPIIMHRPLPADGLIKWARMSAEKHGDGLRWSLQLTVESESFRPKPRKDERVVALDLGGGRRMMDADGVHVGNRVGYLLDLEGVTMEVNMPMVTFPNRRKHKRWVRRATMHFTDVMKHIDTMSSRRKTSFNSVMERLNRFISELCLLPDWLSEESKFMHLWKSPNRGSKLVKRWGKNRFQGDDQMFNVVSVWNAQEVRDREELTNLSERMRASRDEFYRVKAVEIARKYKVIVMEDPKELDLTKPKLAEIPEPEHGDPSDGRGRRRVSRYASPGRFRALLIEAAEKYGATVIYVNPAYTSVTCAGCNKRGVWEDPAALVHECSYCHRVFDRDRNACENLLKKAIASGAVQINLPGPLAVHNLRQGKAKALTGINYAISFV